MTMRRPPPAVVHSEWQRRATAAATEAARKLIGGKIPMMTPVGRLTDRELGWLVMSAICAWIANRAEQACAEGFDLQAVEDALRNPGSENATPSPWDAGAVATILPDLADLKDIDWRLPLRDWSQETMIRFLCAGFELMRQAFASRDVGGTLVKPARDADEKALATII
jgi:hypothetical protein